MPNDRSPILLFDGDCQLCNRWVKFVLTCEAGADIRFASLQSDVGRQLLRQHGFADDRLDTIVFIERDSAYIRSDAVLRIARRLRTPYRWMRVLRLVPRPLRDAAYRLVSRYRIALFGRADRTCPLPPEDIRTRMLG